MAEEIISFNVGKDFDNDVENWQEEGVPKELTDKIIENLNNPETHKKIGT